MRCSNVTKEFPGGTCALDDLSLEIPDGEFLILVGPSGCGKTTALRLIAGLEKATSGTITIGDTSVNGVSPRDRDIAMVFQNYALYPHMTVYRNLGFGLRERRTPRREVDRRVREISAVLGLDELLKRRPAQLSGGQRQRVAMGRALVREPKVFLLDEPLSNLDAKLRVQMRAELKRLHAKLGITTIYVTHDQIEAMTLADRIVVMSAGQALQIGTPQEVFSRPANLFVAGFIGSPAMNLLRGRASAGVRGHRDHRGRPALRPGRRAGRRDHRRDPARVPGARPGRATGPALDLERRPGRAARRAGAGARHRGRDRGAQRRRGGAGDPGRALVAGPGHRGASRRRACPAPATGSGSASPRSGSTCSTRTGQALGTPVTLPDRKDS